MDIVGLSEAEAASRLSADGPNELPGREQRSTVRIVVEVLREPMLAMLVGGGVIYLLLGDAKEPLGRDSAGARGGVPPSPRVAAPLGHIGGARPACQFRWRGAPPAGAAERLSDARG